MAGVISCAISSIEIEEVYDWVDGNKVFRGYSKKIRFNSKNDAIEKLMKHLALFERNNSQVQVSISLNMAPHSDEPPVFTLNRTDAGGKPWLPS
jgi:hypothetical protein